MCGTMLIIIIVRLCFTAATAYFSLLHRAAGRCFVYTRYIGLVSSICLNQSSTLLLQAADLENKCLVEDGVQCFAMNLCFHLLLLIRHDVDFDVGI